MRYSTIAVLVFAVAVLIASATTSYEQGVAKGDLQQDIVSLRQQLDAAHAEVKGLRGALNNVQAVLAEKGEAR